MTSHDSRDSDRGGGRQDRRRRPVTRDTTTGHGDTDLSPGNRDDKPNHPADESRYAATPAIDGQQTADAETVHDATRPTSRIEVEDGHVVATVNPVLTDAAADALWRIIDKAMRKDETR